MMVIYLFIHLLEDETHPRGLDDTTNSLYTRAITQLAQS